jgi:serine/threonine protein kinase
MDPLRF